MNHRIIEYPELEETHKGHECPTPGPAQNHSEKSLPAPENVI